MLRRLVHWLQPIILVLALAAIAWYLATQWPTLRTYRWQLHWGWLLITFVLTLASWGVEIAIWQRLLATLGGKLSYWTAARIWFLSAIVRYIPGNIWQPLSLTFYAKRHGVAPEATLTSIVIFQVVTLLSVIPILLVYFVRIDTKSLAAQLVAQFPPMLLWLTLIPLVAFLLYPKWLVQSINWVLARFNRPPLSLELTSATLAALILVTLFDWLLWGAVFAAFTFAVTGGLLNNAIAGEGVQAIALAPHLIAAYPIASIIGFLSLVTPSGFGVREGAFYLMLTPQIAGSVVAVLALGIRVWGIANEVLMATISAIFERIAMKKRDAGTPLDLSLREPVVATDLHRESL